MSHNGLEINIFSEWHNVSTNLSQTLLIDSSTIVSQFTFSLHNDCYIKGYLRYKTVTSQNVSSEVQVKSFFVSWKSYVPFSRCLSFYVFNYPKIYKICDVMISIITLAKMPFWLYLLNHNSLSHQTWSIDRYKQGQ